MKSIYILFCFYCFLACNLSFAQPSGRFKNEWINYNQQYLKIVVQTKGIYRIPKASIEAKFVQSVGANPQKFQLFHRGEQMAINVDSETPNNYNYIEFYAMNNDGLQDSAVYFPKTARLNENYSLYSDSTSYFLTLGQANGKRIPSTSAVNTGIGADDHFLYKAITSYSNEWNQDIATSILPPATQSYYEPNEGMCSISYFLYFNPPDLQDGTVTPPLAPKPFNTPFPLTGYNGGVGVSVNYEALIVSRNPQNKTIGYDLGNGVAGSFGLTNFNSFKLNQTLPTITGSQIPVYMQITTNPGINDFFSLVYQKAKYPRVLTYVDNLEYETKLNPSGTSRVRLTEANSGIIGYDFTDFKNQKKISTVFNSGDNTIDLSIDGTETSKNIWLSHNVKTPALMRMANFSQIVQSDYNYLIITDPRLSAGATAYKNYRESNDLNGGKKFKVLIKYAQDLYDEFGYGERNPIAVRRFADYMTSTPAKMEYLFLIGKGYTYTFFLRSRSTRDFAPSFGSPGSDNLLTGGLMGLPMTIPAIPTGRLVVGVDDTFLGPFPAPIGDPATMPGEVVSITKMNQEVLNYLEKVNQHEHRLTSSWQKNLLNVVGPKSGGANGLGGEFLSLATITEELRAIAIASPYAANPTNFLTVNKNPATFNLMTQTYPEVAVPDDYFTKVNGGVGILTYFGHGTGVSTSNNIGLVSRIGSNGPPTGGPGELRYNNNGKYPLLIAMGCGISNSFQRDPSLTGDWIKTPGRGAINTIGQSTISYEIYDDRFLHGLFNTWFTGANTVRKGVKNAKPNATNAMLNGAIGDILKQSFINELAQTPGADPAAPNYDIIYGASFQQTILEGDPAIRLLRDPQLLPLSLTLLEVKAYNEDKIVKVNWKTENEIDFNKFELERSIDSKKFEKIGEVKGKGNNQEVSNYSFDDFNPKIGINYYRLKMIDLDGSFDYSKIVSTNYEDIDNQLVILENPFRNNQFNFKMIDLEEKSIKLFDIKGSKLGIELSKVSENNYKVIPNVNLQKGIYVFEAYNKAGTRYFSKIISE